MRKSENWILSVEHLDTQVQQVAQKQTHRCIHPEKTSKRVCTLYIISAVLQCPCRGGVGVGVEGKCGVGGFFPLFRWIMTLIPAAVKILKPPAAGRT